MTLRVLTDTDRQSKLEIDQEKLIAQLGSISKRFAGTSANALENINLEVFQKESDPLNRKSIIKGIENIAKDLLIFFRSESAKNLLSPITANKGTANSRIT